MIEGRLPFARLTCLLFALPAYGQVCYQFSDAQPNQAATYTATVRISEVPASNPANGAPGFVYASSFTSAPGLQFGPGYHYSALDVATVKAGAAEYVFDNFGILISYMPPPGSTGNIVSINGNQFPNTSAHTLTISLHGPSGVNLFPGGLTPAFPPTEAWGQSSAGLVDMGTIRVSYPPPNRVDFSGRVSSITSCSPGASVSAPAIQAGGVLSAGAFGGFTSLSPGSWAEIYGANLAASTQPWTAADFKNGIAPTSLGGTIVTIGGKQAFIDYISPSQVNALVPSDVAVGVQPMTITTAAGTSTAYSLTVNPLQPGLLSPPTFKVNGKQYAVALFADGTYVLPTGAISGVVSRPAKPGETIILYGIGFGPVTPAIPAGQLAQQSSSLASAFQMSIGGNAATAGYAGLAPGFTGLYQFNMAVPNNAPVGDVPLTFTLNGVSGTQPLFIAVQN